MTKHHQNHIFSTRLYLNKSSKCIYNQDDTETSTITLYGWNYVVWCNWYASVAEAE